MAVKTITLDGTEGCITGLCGCYASVLNQGAATVYASPTPDITAGADGVTPVPAGGSALVECGDTLYLLGTGEVTAVGHSQPVPFFKPALSSGEGGADAVARTAIENHEKNTDIHLTAADVASIASNDNALINSNFRINQRGKSEYAYDSSTRGYTVDMWQLVREGNMLTVLDDGVKLGYVSGSSPTLPSHMLQRIENYADYAGCTVTASAYIKETTSAYPQLLIVYKKDGANHHKNMKAAAGLNTISFDIPEDITGLEVWLYGADVRTGDTTDSYSII
ncbi:MAG: hypothetical protein J6A16_03525, partial [Oscillospiraceae bacterium]|nr:hypothetical protein [Oscillospiraceae bacterium]